jgi:LuxR family maltose regulon positive regulatory protein
VINLGIAETWAGQVEDADLHLEQGMALAHQAGRPYLEFTGLAHGARVATFRSLALAEERSRKAIELAGRHGWAEDQVAAFAYTMLGAALTGQGRLAEAEPWLDRAGQTMRAGLFPAAGLNLQYARGLLEMASGRHADALAALQAGDRLASRLVTPHGLVRPLRSLILLSRAALGDTDRAEIALARLDADERSTAHMRVARAALRLAQHDPASATDAIAPILDGTLAGLTVQPSWLAEALLLEATARDALGDLDAAMRALERALDIAETDRAIVPFLLHPVPDQLKRHARLGTGHAALIDDILRLLAGRDNAPRRVPATAGEGAPGTAWLREPLSQAEIRVLCYLPTSLSVTEIAGQLYLSVNTVRTHMRHLYAKLDVHRRHEAVERARILGLLAPAARRAS